MEFIAAPNAREKMNEYQGGSDLFDVGFMVLRYAHLVWRFLCRVRTY
jgi:hypothetical protein